MRGHIVKGRVVGMGHVNYDPKLVHSLDNRAAELGQPARSPRTKKGQPDIAIPWQARRPNLVVAQMNWYDEAHAPIEKLVHAADIRSDRVSAFQAENDRRLPGGKCLPDLGGGGRYRSVGAFCCHCDPA